MSSPSSCRYYLSFQGFWLLPSASALPSRALSLPPVPSVRSQCSCWARPRSRPSGAAAAGAASELSPSPRSPSCTYSTSVPFLSFCANLSGYSLVSMDRISPQVPKAASGYWVLFYYLFFAVTATPEPQDNVNIHYFRIYHLLERHRCLVHKDTRSWGGQRQTGTRMLTQPPPQGGQLLSPGPRGVCSQQWAFKEILQK